MEKLHTKKKSLLNMFLRKIKPNKSPNKILKRDSIADMHIDGIRFSDSDKSKLQEIRETAICNYSGLPSIYTYE